MPNRKADILLKNPNRNLENWCEEQCHIFYKCLFLTWIVCVCLEYIRSGQKYAWLNTSSRYHRKASMEATQRSRVTGAGVDNSTIHPNKEICIRASNKINWPSLLHKDKNVSSAQTNIYDCCTRPWN